MGIKDLIEQLTSGDDRHAEAAAEALAHYGQEALPGLAELIANPDGEARWWATRALAEIQQPQALGLLITALSDQEAPVRHCAALALRQQASPQALPHLLARLGEDDRLLARLSADALIAIGGQAVGGLVEAMRTGAPSARLEAVRALARIGDPRAIPALFETLGGDSALLEHWASRGLERMGVGMLFFKRGG